VRAAGADRRPALELHADYTRHSTVPELELQLPGGQVETIFPSIPDHFGSRVALSFPLYTGGRVGGSIDAAQQRLAAAQSDVETGEAELVLETTAAYWTLVTSRESERVLREALASFDAHLRDAENLERFGMAARNDVLAVRVERERAELRRLRAENDARVAHDDLVRLLDLAPGSLVQAVEPLDGGDAEARPEGDLEALVREALAARSERPALAARAAALDASARVSRSARRPQLRLVAGYDYSRPNLLVLPYEDEWNDTWDAGIRLTMSIYEGGRAAATAAQATHEAEALRRALDDLDRRIRHEVTARRLDLETARQAVAVAAAGVASARENVRVARDRYREGVSPSSELLDAETALLGAGLDHTAALANRRLARTALDRALGR
jgi:outer membrane protein TolC